MVDIYTAHYRYGGPDRVDITVKGQDPKWKQFAPTWDMVMGTKNGTMTEEEYVQRYLQIVDKVPVKVLKELFELGDKHGSLTFVCFCPENDFCHRNILTRVLVDRVATARYGGFRQ